MPLGDEYLGEGYIGSIVGIYGGGTPPAPGLPPSYTTNQIYYALPQFVQDTDAANNYALYYYLYGVCQVLDKVDNLTFDNIGAGVTVQPTTNAPINITQAKLLNNMGQLDYSFYVFGTDPTWSQANTSSNFSVMLEEEEIFISGGPYDWSLPQVELFVLARGYNNTIQTSHLASSGDNGTIDMNNYAEAPGWSQVLDINRCPSYALPWLGQFVGAQLAVNNKLSYQDTLEKIQTRSGLQRSTVPSIKAEMVSAVNSQIGGGATALLPSQVIVLENTILLNPITVYLNGNISNSVTTINILGVDQSWGNLGSNSSFVIQIDSEYILIPARPPMYYWAGNSVTITGVTRGVSSTGAGGGSTAVSHTGGALVNPVGPLYIYSANEYAFTVLIPASHYNVYTYASLVIAAGGDGTYAAVNAFVATLGGTYGDISGSSHPTNGSGFVDFISRYRPAGIEVFVGAY